MQKQITQKCKLLNEEGELTNPGYSTSLIQEYSRNDIKHFLDTVYRSLLRKRKGDHRELL